MNNPNPKAGCIPLNWDIRNRFLGHKQWVRGDVGRFYRLGSTNNRFPYQDFKFLLMQDQDLRQVFVNYINFDNSDLSRTDLSLADINYCSLRQTDLTGVNFTDAEIEHTDIRGARFTTEFLSARTLYWIKCDDEQLPWLIPHKRFKRLIDERSVQCF